MVLYKKQKAALSDPLVLPSEFNANTKIFVIKETGEWFARYEDYIKRLWFYMQKNFTCEITSHSNLTFFQAMASEELEFNNLETKFPLKLRDPVAHYLHFNPTSRFDHLLEETYAHFKKLYFAEESVFLKNMNKTTADGVLINNINDNVFVTEFLKTHNMQFDRDAATMFQEANGLTGDVNEIGVDLSFPWIIKEKIEPNYDNKTRYLIYQPSSFISIEVTVDEIGRDRQAFTRHLLRSFMKLTIVKASRKNGSPWCVKQDYLKHYNLSMDWPSELLKYKEEPKIPGRRKRKASPDLNTASDTPPPPPKKRGRPKSIPNPNEIKEPPKKRGRKRKNNNNQLETHIMNLKDNVTHTISDGTVTTANGSDNNNKNNDANNNDNNKKINNDQGIGSVENYNDVTPDFKTPNISTPEPFVEPVFHYNPNIAKIKQTITSDVEIPRVMSRVNDVLNNEEICTLRTALIEEILNLREKKDDEADEITENELYNQLEKLYTDIYVYGGDLSPKDDINRNIADFHNFLKEFGESFDTMKFVNCKTEYNFTQIFKIYKFLVDFDKVLILEPLKFDNFLTLLNNEKRFKNMDSVKTMHLEFSNENYDEINDTNEKITIAKQMCKSFFAERNIKLHLKEVVKENCEVDSKEDTSEDETYINLSLDKNPNKFLLELICALLRLFIDNKGDWRVNVPETWIDIDGNSEIDKEAAILKQIPTDHQLFIENCINYKDISFSQRLIKRQFNNGIWCFILIGVLEDSFHIQPYQDKIKNIIDKFYVENTTKNTHNLNKMLWENFNYDFNMNDKLDVIEVLIDLLLNFGSDIKQDLELQMDVVNNCKSERFKLNRVLKSLVKEKLSVDNTIETSKNTEEKTEEIQKTLESELIKQKELADKITLSEWQKTFWDDKISAETSIRLRPLGQDRYGHRYWYLESTGNFDINNPHSSSLQRCGKIFIQGPSKEEIPFFFNGLSHEQYCQKIKEYKLFPNGSVINEHNVPILFPRNIWNNELDNESLSNLDWKMIDWRQHHLLSDSDWCFIDDDDSVKNLMSWLHKNGSKERVLRNNLSCIIENFESKIKNENDKTLLYSKLFRNEKFAQLIDEIKNSLNLLDEKDCILLQSISQNDDKFAIFNSLLVIDEATTNGDELENDTFNLFSDDKILIDLTRKHLKIENQLDPILSKCIELEDMESKYPNSIQELKNLNEKKEALNNNKMEILAKIENREKELKVIIRQERLQEIEAKKDNTEEAMESVNDLVHQFKTSATLSKLDKVIKLINQFLQTVTKNDEMKLIINYKNSFAIEKFGKNIFNGAIEKRETGKNKNNDSQELLSLQDRMDKLNAEVDVALKNKEKELN